MKRTPSFFLVNKGKEIMINQEKIGENFKKPEQFVMRKLYPDLIYTGLFLVFRRNIIGTRKKLAFGRKVLKVKIFKSGCFYGNRSSQYLYIGDYDLGFISV